MKSNYVVAGFETLASIIDRFINNTKDRYDNHFSRDDISNFFESTTAGFLHSFGQNFKDKKKFHKYNQQEAGLYKECRDMGLFNNSDFIVDSGGFQISVGLLDRQKTKLLYKLYYEFLVDYVDVYDRAFILDVPPGPNCQIFKNFKDVQTFNQNSYNKARELPQKTKDKIIYIHHFRTPELWKIFKDILNDGDMFNEFKHHGTGGIVANSSGDAQIPCIIYVLPLIPLINQCIKYGRKTLDFHVLGGANFRDIMFYELFRKLVLEKHGIEVNITYDSSGLFKGIMVGRRMFINEGQNITKVDLRSKNLPLRYRDDKKIVDIVKDSIHEFSNKYNIKDLPKDFEIYEGDDGTFYEEVKIYLMLHSLDQYALVQENMRNIANELYPLYENRNLLSFNRGVENITRAINSGKITKKQRAKTNSVIKSLDMLSDLDEDYCEFIVSKFLSKDEFTNLTEDRILTF